jgi:hypothetical protein
VRPRLAEAQRSALLAAAALALVALVVLAFAGQWEKRRWVDEQLRGMARIERLVGPLDQRSLIGFRVLPQFDCLVYRRGPDLLALELCVDRNGRLVEAIDRRGGARRYYDLHADPGAASIRLDRAEVDRLLRKMGAT